MIRSIVAANPSAMTLDGTRTYLVGRREPVVIDPGPAVEGHLDAVLAALGGAAPVAILLTHHHADHAELAPALAAATGAAVRAWPELGEGATIPTDAGAVRVLHTPGHTADHLSFWLEAERVLFAGDAFMGGQDTVLVAAPEGDLAAYLATLERVERLAPRRILPAHGPELEDGAAAARRYRAHREARIAQVVAALEAAGPVRPDALVDAVYGAALQPELRAAAAASVAAIAHYLEQTGRMIADADGTLRLRPLSGAG